MLTTYRETTFEEIISVLKEKIMANPFCHVELNTTDLKKAKDFYSKLFDWKLEDMDSPGGSYTMIRVGEGTGGGMMKNPIPGAPSFWLAYILVDDIQASTKKAKSLGANVMKDVTEIPTSAGSACLPIRPALTSRFGNQRNRRKVSVPFCVLCDVRSKSV